MTSEGSATLSEYMSCETLCRLVHLCLEETQVEPAAEELAARLGVSQRTVEKWIRGRPTSCKSEVDALIAYAIKIRPHKAAKILKRDLDTHRRMLVVTLVKAILAGDLKPEAEA